MVVSKEQLIKNIADREGIDVASVRDVIAGMENLVYAYLSSATPTENITVKPLKGLSITSVYEPAHEAVHPYTREKLMVTPRIWSSSKISRYFNRKLNT